MRSPVDFGRTPPKGWRTYRMKDVAAHVNRGVAPEYSDGDTGLLAFNQKCVRPDLKVAPELGRPVAEGSFAPSDPAVLRVGDIVVNSTGRGTLGRAAMIRSDPELPIIADGHVTIIRLRPAVAEARFVAYILGTPTFYEQANTCLAVGATNQTELNREALRRMTIVLPPVEEQRRITAYLDNVIAKIDALVDEHVLQSDLLTERFYGVMKAGVTGRLGYSGPTHEVGPYWLGPVPQSWLPEKIAWRFATGSGTTPPSGRMEFYDGDVPWVNTGELRETVINSTAKTVTESALKEFSALRVYPAGSVVVALYGATIGRVGTLGLDATVNQACCVLHRPTSVLPDFVFHWLWAHREEIAALGAGGGQPNISQETIRGLRVPAPDLASQSAIVEALRVERERFEALVSELDRDVELLNEHRQALITAAVSGGLEALQGVA